MIDMKLSIPSDKHRDQQHTITRVVIITFNFISFEKYVIAVSTISLTALYVMLVCDYTYRSHFQPGYFPKNASSSLNLI